jgi:hypothetical protein
VFDITSSSNKTIKIIKSDGLFRGNALFIRSPTLLLLEPATTNVIVPRTLPIPKTFKMTVSVYYFRLIHPCLECSKTPYEPKFAASSRTKIIFLSKEGIFEPRR